MTPQGLQLIKQLPQIWRNAPWWRRRNAREQPEWVKEAQADARRQIHEQMERALRQKLLERQMTELIREHVPMQKIEEIAEAHFPGDTTIQFTVTFQKPSERVKSILRQGDRV